MKSVLLIAAIVFIGFGCKMPWDNTNSNQTDNSNLTGTWTNIKDIHYWGSLSNPDSTAVDELEPEDAIPTYIFNANNYCEIKIYEPSAKKYLGPITGNWSTSGDQLTISMKNAFSENETTTFKYEIRNNQLMLFYKNEVKMFYDTYDWSASIFERQ